MHDRLSKAAKELRVLEPADSVLPSAAHHWLEPDTRQRRTGCPDAGTIHHIKQVHTVYRESDSELRSLGVGQLSILGHLETLGAEDLFVEGVYRTLSSANPAAREDLGSYHYWLLPSRLRAQFTPATFADEVKALFGQESISDAHLTLLGALGGPFIRACLHPEVTLHRTVRTAADSEVARRQNGTNADETSRRRLVFSIRERMAMNEVASWLSKNPGGNAYLIYGRAHDFDAAVAWRWRGSSRSPALVEIDFPGAVEVWRLNKQISREAMLDGTTEWAAMCA